MFFITAHFLLAIFPGQKYPLWWCKSVTLQQPEGTGLVAERSACGMRGCGRRQRMGARAREGGGSLCELARRVNSLRGATGEGAERLPGKAVKAVRSLARSSPSRSATTNRPRLRLRQRRCAVLLSGVISWWESEVMARKVSQ